MAAFSNLIRNIKHLASNDLQVKDQRSTDYLQMLTNMVGGINNIATHSMGEYIPANGEYNYNNALSSMRITTVFTCVLVRAESLSTLPASVKQSTADGPIDATTDPANKLIKYKPNPFQTAVDFWKTVCMRIDLYGNCFCIVTYVEGQPVRIDIITDGKVLIHETSDGRCVYEHKETLYQYNEILHFKDLSLDGYYGCSRITWNAETLGYSAKLKKFGSNSIGIKPPGYFSTEQTFDTVKKQEEKLSSSWNENIAVGMTPILPYGLKYNNLQISPGDAQYLEAIGATKEDIYGIFRIPPSLAQDYERATWSNAEQQDLVFVKYTMLPIIANIEQECNAKLFPESNYTAANPFYVKFNVNAFMRGDFKTRTEGYRTLWERGLISGNMVADFEDWNHFAGGDERFIPMNMIPLSKVDQFIDKLTAPVNTNVADGGGDNSSRKESIDEFIDRMVKVKKVNGQHHG